MPQVIVSANAFRNLGRLNIFLREKNPTAARNAAQAIKKTLLLLEDNPQLGRSVEDMEDDYREVIIEFGKTGYLARYRFDSDDDKIIVLAVRHQLELDY